MLCLWRKGPVENKVTTCPRVLSPWFPLKLLREEGGILLSLEDQGSKGITVPASHILAVSNLGGGPGRNDELSDFSDDGSVVLRLQGLIYSEWGAKASLLTVGFDSWLLLGHLCSPNLMEMSNGAFHPFLAPGDDMSSDPAHFPG